MLLQRLIGIVALWGLLMLFVSRTTEGLEALVHGQTFLMVLSMPVVVAALAHGPAALISAVSDAVGATDVPLGGDLPAARRRASSLVLRTIGGASVAVGVVAVLTGMVHVMNTITATSGQASPIEVAFGVGALFVAPLYGVALRTFLWDPLADAVEGAVDGVAAEIEAAD